ncbi:unnamed protein product [Moneuplotes crassus]|uniref:Uncharacterized protein n=1 Tax=Euplotes crassus TaxID=5936 RepID=A0AAD1X9A5_EUPCR|nr:unnamed protein product [Moneuplotes crassus]
MLSSPNRKTTRRSNGSLVSVASNTNLSSKISKNPIKDVVIYDLQQSRGSSFKRARSPSPKSGIQSPQRFFRNSGINKTEPMVNLREKGSRAIRTLKKNPKFKKKLRVAPSKDSRSYKRVMKQSKTIKNYKKAHNQRLCPFSSHSKIKNICFISMQKKIMLHKKKNKDQAVRVHKNRVFRPKTERTSQIGQIGCGETGDKEYFELDVDGKDNMFNMSIEDRNKSTLQTSKPTKNPIDIQKIIHNMNHISTKPTLLTTNPITKEDPSWGTGTKKAHELVHLAEEKGYYEHLSTFLEGTIHKRREAACTSIVPYPHEDPNPKKFRDVVVDTGECSFNSLTFKNSLVKELSLTKVTLGNHLKQPMASKTLVAKNNRIKSNSRKENKIETSLSLNQLRRKRARPTTAIVSFKEKRAKNLHQLRNASKSKQKKMVVTSLLNDDLNYGNFNKRSISTIDDHKKKFMCNQPQKVRLKSKRNSQTGETPPLLYRKGKLPSNLKNKKPTKGGLSHYKKDLTIDPYSLQKSHQLKNLYTKDSSKI